MAAHHFCSEFDMSACCRHDCSMRVHTSTSLDREERQDVSAQSDMNFWSIMHAVHVPLHILTPIALGGRRGVVAMRRCSIYSKER